jgi:peptidyl-dipeptidase A
MPADAFAKDAARLYAQVQPLYKDLQCYARARTRAEVRRGQVPAGKPIPAHLFGNMWAQQWDADYDVFVPYPAASALDVDRRVEEAELDAIKMTRARRRSMTSIGFPPLPQKFWERSMLTQPRDREVRVPRERWEMNMERRRAHQDVHPADRRGAAHHLSRDGHVYYYLWYKDQPTLFHSGAHDGFHEAIGDTITLSMTPAYLAKIGCVPSRAAEQEALINQQMRMALEKIAFLPFGKVIDEWRWKVFSGEITPRTTIELVGAARAVPGHAPPVARTEADFDPGRQVPRPGNTPYTRYFLSVHHPVPVPEGAVRRGGFQGPAVTNARFSAARKPARKFAAMLSKARASPWQDTMYALTGTRQMDGSAILEYFRAAADVAQAAEQGQAVRLVTLAIHARGPVAIHAREAVGRSVSA